MKKIFSFAFEISLDSIIINLSPQKYHICSKCFVQFSSISRLLIHAQKNCNQVFTCKHCEKTFTSNNKLHEHVRLHKKMFDKTLKQRFVERKDNHINSSISSFTSSIIFKSMTTSTKSSYLFISMTKAQVARFIEFSIDFSITSITFSINSQFTSTILIESIAFTSSRHHKFTYMFFTSSITSESTSAILKSSHHSISMQKTLVTCSFTSSSTSSRSLILSHAASKTYMTIKKLFEMFAEKTRKKNRSIIQKKSTFSCFSESRQIRIKSLCSQENLKDSTIIAKKQFKKK